jgi:hypothetical protein
MWVWTKIETKQLTERTKNEEVLGMVVDENELPQEIVRR